jgi:hypothetical protein
MACRLSSSSSRDFSLRAVLLVGLACLITSPARGANPASGTVTPSSQTAVKVKIVNPGLAPVTVWSAATPLLAR